MGSLCPFHVSIFQIKRKLKNLEVDFGAEILLPRPCFPPAVIDISMDNLKAPGVREMLRCDHVGNSEGSREQAARVTPSN